MCVTELAKRVSTARKSSLHMDPSHLYGDAPWNKYKENDVEVTIVGEEYTGGSVVLTNAGDGVVVDEMPMRYR